jgi:hypothetical protein
MNLLSKAAGILLAEVTLPGSLLLLSAVLFSGVIAYVKVRGSPPLVQALYQFTFPAEKAYLSVFPMVTLLRT